MNQEQFIHKFIPGKTPDDPTLLLLHGTGGNEDSLIEVGQELLPSANFLSPRGKVLEHGMPRFFRRLTEGVFDLEDLHQRTTELRDFILEMRVKYTLTNSPFVAVGYSNGANIAASLLMTYPHILQGAILFRAMLPFQPIEPPDTRSNIPVLLLNGEHDHIVSRETTLSLVSELEKLGISVDLHWLPGGHQLGYSDILYAKEWLAKNML